MSELDVFGGRPFTAAMAEASGISAYQLRRLVAEGLVRPVLYGVYTAASTPDSTRLSAAAGSLVLPEHVVVADRFAAALWGIDVLDHAELDVLPALEVVSYDGHERTRRVGVLGGERDLLPTEITELDGIAVTTPIRTVCDLACLRGRYRAIGVLDEFRRKFGFSVRELEAMLPRYVGRRGVSQLRELIPLSTHEADSQPESWCRLMIHDDGLPMPSPQVWVDVPGWGRAKIENAYERLRAAVEYDGPEFHTSDEDREHDAARRDALRRQLDWHVIVVRRDGLAPAARDIWLRELRAVVADRLARPLKRIYARAPGEPPYRPRRRRRL